GFTVEAVARRAGVARMTVYYQFGTKVGLLEALNDGIATGGGIDRLPEAFRMTDPEAALRTFVAAFSGLWASDRAAIRRLQALTALDPEIGQVARGRHERRRQGLRVLLGRLARERSRPAPEE